MELAIESELTWVDVWRRGFAPLMPTRGLRALRTALVVDDERLLQGATVTPPPLYAVRDWPVEAACGIGYCGWQSSERMTAGELEEWFTEMCVDVDETLGEVSACRYWLNWFDDTPRDEMRASLLEEVDRELLRREGVAADAPVLVRLAE